MGNQYIDAIWLLPIGVIVGIIWLVFRLGIEVGRDQVQQEIRVRRQSRTVAPQPTMNGNVIPLHNHK